MFDSIPTWTIGLPETGALAAVALIGYLFGRRTRGKDGAIKPADRQVEFDRATRIAHQLERIAGSLRRELATHHAQVAQFKRRLHDVQHNGDSNSWVELCDEAEAIMRPTLILASQLSQAYDQIRKQSNALLTFTDGRIDPVTGVGNGKALEEQLNILLPALDTGGAGVVVALVGIDLVGRTAEQSQIVCDDQLLQDVAVVVQKAMRDADFVARYGADEFVVVMPQASQTASGVFGTRLRQLANADLPCTLSCGVALAVEGDSMKTLLARADSALYSAKAAGTNRQFVHNGANIREYLGSRANDSVKEVRPIAVEASPSEFVSELCASTAADA